MELLNFHAIALNNQCLVCGQDSLTNFLDLTLITSRTSQSETPVKDKLKMVLGDKWIAADAEKASIICLPCFHLLDQFDLLEVQLQNIRLQLTNKYVMFHGTISVPIEEPPNTYKLDQLNNYNKGVKSKKTVNCTKKNTVPARRKKSSNLVEIGLQNNSNVIHPLEQVDPKKSKADALMWQSHTLQPLDNHTSHLPSLAGTSQPLDIMVSDTTTTWRTLDNGPSCRNDLKYLGSVSQQSNSDDEDDQADVIYEENPNLLSPGERFRIGTVVTRDGNGISFNCAYCTDIYGDIPQLQGHLYNQHRPIVLTTQIPVELGLGNKLNCGVQLTNITLQTEFSKPFVCIYCDSAFKFKSNIHLHYKEKHTPHKPFSCMDCHETFRRSIELSRHRVYYCSHRKKGNTADKKVK